MRVEVDGRQTFRISYLKCNVDKLTSAKKSINKPYDLSIDGPKATRDAAITSKTPLTGELQYRDGMMAYLEVGLVLGDDPDKYTLSAKSKGKKYQEAQEKRGRMPRKSDALRVFMPINQDMIIQPRYFVAAPPPEGTFETRTIKAETFFFYEEFWRDVPQTLNASDKRNAINQNAARAAAVSNTVQSAVKKIPTLSMYEKSISSDQIAIASSTA
ncbi:hypothetical protein AMS68_007999 [Peltaster fructicola]|uniref:Uncharacterized protein n=1 Tax=Peltaster fructicola TaxID=286661 RepID=A0A6H0Y602_9PEZI|nr:hypothetical protein AMS68_007999 [Peltaster fructicola]